jgi:hypothetical protein
MRILLVVVDLRASSPGEWHCATDCEPDKSMGALPR